MHAARLFLLAVSAWSGHSTSPAPNDPRPNVLFLAIDDLRTELGCYGATHIQSPHIDALAEQGVRFERAFCQQALCGPSRASVLTGLRPDSARVHGNHVHFREHYPNITTLPQHFRNHGYHTRAMGKIYHGVFPEGSSITVADTFGDPESWSIPAFRPGPRYYYTEEGIEAARRVYEQLYRPTDPGPDDWTTKLVFGPASEAPDVPDSVLYDGQVADHAIASIAELAAHPDQPFFLAVGFIKPHSPYIAPREYWDRYDPQSLPVVGPIDFPADIPSIALHGSGELRRYTDQPGSGPISEEAQRRIRHAYAACTSFVDAQVGRVLAALDDHGLADHTIVVLWSDHGYHLGERNLWGKTTNFELDTRVPLIVRAPGRAGNGQSSTALVELVDLYPTLAELCGLPRPSMLEGSSLVPLLDRPDRAWKSAVFSQTTRGKRRGHSIRTMTHRYTEWRRTDTREVEGRELYAYEGDPPDESANLAETQPDLVAELSRRLAMGHGWKPVRAELPIGTPKSVRPARVFTDAMVLPRGRAVPIWGTGAPGTTVQVTFEHQSHETITDATGRWQVTLDPLPASSKPRDLVIGHVRLRDVVVGDVWYCAGQSNMRWRLDQSLHGDAEIADAEDPGLRLLDLTAELYPVRREYDLAMLRDTDAHHYYDWSGWRSSAPDSAATFSAVAWHFGRRMRELRPEVPVGLIHTAIGGSPMEAWIPEAALLADPQLESLVNVDWWRDDHPRFPFWCGLRGRENLAAYFAAPDGPAPDHPFRPGFLFEAGVQPFRHWPVAGVLWYQGESNATRHGGGSPAIDPSWNEHLFRSVIRGFREAFDQPRLPFVFAQLPGLDRRWPLFREMQRKVARDDEDVHMAVTLDVGHPTDVHPTHKRPVGRRMAELALNLAGSPEVTQIAPTAVQFDRPLMTSDGEKVRGFQIAGADRVFHSAVATLNGGRVTLACDAVAEPVAVRYAWANDPDANLVGAYGGHPVSPFRNDEWETGDLQDGETPEPPGASQDATDGAAPFTGFENAPAGPLTRAVFDGATWSAPEGHAVVLDRLARRGRHCLQLTGGDHSWIEFVLEEERDYGLLTFAAERWTRRDPFRFRIEAASREGSWSEVFVGDDSLRVGRAYLNQVRVSLPAGTRRLRMSCTAPSGTGVLLDDLALREAREMIVQRVAVVPRTVPLLIGATKNVLLRLEIETDGGRSPCELQGATFVIEDGGALRTVRFVGTDLNPDDDPMSFETAHRLVQGRNVLELEGELGAGVGLDDLVTARCVSVLIDGQDVIPEDSEVPVQQRVGVVVRDRGQDGVHTHRIPGLTTTNAGTLIAVYDRRNRGSGDLPGDIDVGMSRSTDGGRTWSTGRIILDMGADPAWQYDGVGDPSVLTDRVNGTVWVAATWSHGNRSWHGSGPGLAPEETGQFMLVRSDDDGVTWSEPVNITVQAKTDPDWRFVLPGPGRGITLRDGTLVFPAQYRGVNEAPVNGKPFSTILSSKDRGATWQLGRGVKIDTTEAQVVQLADDSILINCRDNRGGSRSVYTTTDLGHTWTAHPSTRSALPEPVCNAGLVRIEDAEFGPLLIFSNPNTTRGRSHMTLKVSRDEGATWPERWHTLYDERECFGYSIVSPVVVPAAEGAGSDAGDSRPTHVGVLYEGKGELYFLRYSFGELLGSR